MGGRKRDLVGAFLAFLLAGLVLSCGDAPGQGVAGDGPGQWRFLTAPNGMPCVSYSRYLGAQQGYYGLDCDWTKATRQVAPGANFEGDQ